MILKKYLFQCTLLFLFPILCFSQQYNISGTIHEEKSGESVVGVSISLYSIKENEPDKILTGTYTNKFGFFSIPKIESGKYQLIISGVGYERYKKLISLNSDQNLDIRLKQIDIKLQEVKIEKEKYTIQDHNISAIDVLPEIVTKMPSLGGETDVFRTLQLLPGVKQSSEISSGLYVRGGSPDQNLTLLDGVIVYNPSHLGGFLSTFNSDALKDIKLIKGGFPAEYGGRISSVLDLTMREGTQEKITGSGGISLINSRLTIEGPINDKSTFMISGRRMYLDLILGMANNSNEFPNYYFYDLNAKFNYKISEKDQIYLSGYFGKDNLTYLQPDEKTIWPNDGMEFNVNWGNSTANLRWMHIESPALFTNFSLIHTNYYFNSYIFYEENHNYDIDSKSKVQDFMLKTEAQYFYDQKNTIKAGLETIWHDFKPGITFTPASGFESAQKGKNDNWSSLETSIYFQDDMNISQFFNVNFGGRIYYFQKGNYLNFEPRVNASYLLNENTSVKSSISMANQYLHLISRSDINFPIDLWLPSTEKIKPSKAWQATLGIETSIFKNEYFLSGEIYYKNMQNLYDYKDSASFSPFTPLEDYFTEGEGKAYGLEIFLNKRIGNFTGWIGYTLSWTKQHFSEINNGRYFYPKYDRRHDISLVLTYNIGEKWELGLSWVYGTGQPFSVPSGRYPYLSIYPFTNPDEKVNQSNYTATGNYYSEKNSYRLPAFHKLDLNFIHKFSWFNLPFQFSINIYNAYNHANPFLWRIEYVWSENKAPKAVIRQTTLFPILPTFGLSFKF
jgi:hypothetical protein